MLRFEVTLSKQAESDIIKLLKSDPPAYKKVKKLLAELYQHPTAGTGKPKPLGGDRFGQWSRRITDKHRLIYEIREKEVLVLVLSSYGHYGDK